MYKEKISSPHSCLKLCLVGKKEQTKNVNICHKIWKWMLFYSNFLVPKSINVKYSLLSALPHISESNFSNEDHISDFWGQFRQFIFSFPVFSYDTFSNCEYIIKKDYLFSTYFTGCGIIGWSFICILYSMLNTVFSSILSLCHSPTWNDRQ